MDYKSFGLDKDATLICEKNRLSQNIMVLINRKTIVSVRNIALWGGATEHEFRTKIVDNIVFDTADVDNANLVDAWLDSRDAMFQKTKEASQEQAKLSAVELQKAVNIQKAASDPIPRDSQIPKALLPGDWEKGIQAYEIRNKRDFPAENILGLDSILARASWEMKNMQHTPINLSDILAHRAFSTCGEINDEKKKDAEKMLTIVNVNDGSVTWAMKDPK